jgi:hypothetical protein
MLGLVLSLSPAMAQVSSSPDQIISFDFFQEWLLHNPFVGFVGFGIVASGISFLIGFILALKPIFIQPVGKTEIKSLSVDRALVISGFFLTIPWFTIITFITFFLVINNSIVHLILNPSSVVEPSSNSVMYNYSITNVKVLGLWVCIASLFVWVSLGIFFVIVIYEIYEIESKLIKKLSKIKGKTLQSFYCIYCRKQLKMLASPSCFLNEQEQVAHQLGSTIFETWYCQNCYPEINRQSIHLKAHRDTPIYRDRDRSDKFKECSVCQEVTMTRSFKFIPKGNPEEETKQLITYTCQCCHRKEEKIRVIHS